MENWPTLDQLARKFHGLPDECYRIKSKDEIKVQMKKISTADHLVSFNVFNLSESAMLYCEGLPVHVASAYGQLV